MKYTVSLKNNRDFQKLYRRGKNGAGPHLAVYCRRNGTSKNRVGITVSVKLGKAVWRNRVKRRLREAYRLSESRIISGYDIILIGRKAAHDADFNDLLRGFLRVCEKLGIIREPAR